MVRKAYIFQSGNRKIDRTLKNRGTERGRIRTVCFWSTVISFGGGSIFLHSTALESVPANLWKQSKREIEYSFDRSSSYNFFSDFVFRIRASIGWVQGLVSWTCDKMFLHPDEVSRSYRERSSATPHIWKQIVLFFSRLLFVKKYESQRYVTAEIILCNDTAAHHFFIKSFSDGVSSLSPGLCFRRAWQNDPVIPQ